MTFERITARHVANDLGINIKFINAEQLRYGSQERWIDLPAETIIAADGAPDGRIVTLGGNLQWSDGTVLTGEEIATIRADLSDASVPLRSNLRFRM